MDYEDSPTRNYKVNLSIIGNRTRFYALCIQTHFYVAKYHLMSLTSFSVPPSSPRIRNQGQELITNGRLGPVAENELIDLTCDTVGGISIKQCLYVRYNCERMFHIYAGYPIPELTWWLSGQLIDDSYYLAHKDTVINDLKDFKVTR